MYLKLDRTGIEFQPIAWSCPIEQLPEITEKDQPYVELPDGRLLLMDGSIKRKPKK